MSKITSVTWSEYVVGAPDSATGSHRVKLRNGGTNSTVQEFQNGTDTPNASTWSRQASPLPTEQLSEMTFRFAFWNVKLTRDDTGEALSYLQQGSVANVDVSLFDPNATFTGEAHAYFVWIPTGGPDPNHTAPHYVLIDAFDSSLNDFIPDDPFVNVSVSSSGGGANFTLVASSDPLNVGANDLGFVDTDVAIPLGELVKISAKTLPDALYGRTKQFSTWLPITVSGSATVGQGNPCDIIVGHDDFVVAFAIYHDTNEGPTKLPGNWHRAGVEMYELESLRSEVSQMRQQLTAVMRLMADQEERATTLARRFDTATTSIMALSARVETLMKPYRPGQDFIGAEAGRQLSPAPVVARRGFFARLFRHGA